MLRLLSLLVCCAVDNYDDHDKNGDGGDGAAMKINDDNIDRRNGENASWCERLKGLVVYKLK